MSTVRTLGAALVACCAIGAGVSVGGLPSGGGAEMVLAEQAAATEPGPPLLVAEDGSEAGYERDAFGNGWAPAVGPGCDVRDAVLARDLGATQVEDECDVTAGTLHDPYTGETVSGSTRRIDVDHVVPLSLAWRTGAAEWPAERREAFANDPGNLLAVGASGNRSKGDKGPEEWMPEAGRCDYARRFAAVLAEWDLTATPERVHAIEGACP